MNSPFSALALALIWFWFGSLEAATVTVVPASDGHQQVVLENDVLRLEVNPLRGARVDSFRCKQWGAHDIIQDRSGQQGLLIDHFWQEAWPGQFWEAKYDVQVLTPGPAAEVAVKFSCLSQNKGIPQVAGILLEKTIALREKDRTVRVTIRLTNTTTEGKYLGYWLQNICWLGGDKAGDLYFRPSRRGVSQTSVADVNPPNAGFVRDPQAGWSAAVDEKTQTGLVCTMDFNDLWFIYNCTGASTFEWQYDAMAIPAGKSWETPIALIPVAGLKTISYVSSRLLLGASIAEDQAVGRLHLTMTCQAAAEPLKSLAIQVAMEPLLSHRQETTTAPPLGNLDAASQTVAVSLPYDTVKREPAVIRLTATGTTARGEAFSESTELWYRGSRISNDDPNSTDGSPFYAIKGPKKVKRAIKPDRIVRSVKERPQALFLKGFLSPYYHLEEALRQARPDVEIKVAYACNAGVFGPQLDFFPYDYDALMSYDLVILGDVSAAYLGDTALTMLCDYREHGGNLLVLGGPFAFGAGGYRGTALETVLPVTGMKSFDLRPVAKGAKMTCGLDLVPPDSAARLRPAYLHEIKAKPGADVLVSCGGWPMVVLGPGDGGRTGCVLAPPLGDTDFCSTPQWQEVLAETVKRLGMKR